MEEILDSNKALYRWNDATCDEFLALTLKYLELQKGLANHFDEQDPPIALFHTTIKSHMLVHCALYAYGINPTVVWNYMGEDFMKRMKPLAQSNTRGTHWSDVNGKLVEQYVQGMDLFLLDENIGFFR
jgi:hypothetical protein